jgi:hypothetical protein
MSLQHGRIRYRQRPCLLLQATAGALLSVHAKAFVAARLAPGNAYALSIWTMVVLQVWMLYIVHDIVSVAINLAVPAVKIFGVAAFSVVTTIPDSVGPVEISCRTSSSWSPSRASSSHPAL